MYGLSWCLLSFNVAQKYPFYVYFACVILLLNVHISQVGTHLNMAIHLDTVM